MTVTTPADWHTIATTAQQIAIDVGQTLLAQFGQAQAEEKADGSLVTQWDKWADRTLRAQLQQAFPDHGVLSEETPDAFPAGEWCWVIDPIDGTTNFTRGVPLWGVSLGLLYQGTPVFGLVHLPPIQQTFHGVWIGASGLPGTSGAWRNDQPIQASDDRPSGNHFFSLCARSTAVMQQDDFPCKLRMLGVATYNLLTVGAGIAIGGVEATPKIWDIAAVWAIVQGAGAVWVPLETAPIFPLQPGTLYHGRPFPTLVVNQADLVPTFRPYVSFLERSAT